MVGNSAIVRYPERGSGAYLLFSPFTNFLTTSSTHCDQHYQLATMGKEAINPGSSTTMKTETVDVTDEDTGEVHLYKHMHLLPSNPTKYRTPGLHINPMTWKNSITYAKMPKHIRKWFCGHCRNGPMNADYHSSCLYCHLLKDSTSTTDLDTFRSMH